MLDLETQRIIAVRLNFASIGIIASLLLVILLQKKVSEKKVRRALVFNLFMNLFMAGCECLSWATSFIPKYYLLNKIVIYCDAASAIFCFISVLFLIKTITSHLFTFNKKLFIVLNSIEVFVVILLFFSPIRELIYYFDDETMIGYNGKLFYYWYFCGYTAVLVGMIYGAIKLKGRKIKDTIIISVYFFLPSVFVILGNKWWSSIVSILFASFSMIVVFCITYQNILKYRLEENNRQKLEIAEMKSTLLLSQIQPHFLYNTLTTLKFLCETSPMEASELCDNFSSYLRTNIDAVDDSGLVDFQKELVNIENYLKIEQARFGKRVNYKFDIKTDAFSVPVLSIQTIVENAVKKGICKIKQGGLITIQTYEEGDNIIIKVIDNGVGFDMTEYLSDGKNHVGLSNTRERLKMINGEIKVESEVGKGTTIVITLPKEED